MASELRDIELEDGEINELEDGEIEDDETPVSLVEEAPKLDNTQIPKFQSFRRGYSNHDTKNVRDERGNNSSFPWKRTTYRKEENSLVRPVPPENFDRERDNVNPRMRVRPSFHIPQESTGSRGNHVQGGYGRQNNPSWNRGNSPRTSPLLHPHQQPFSPGPPLHPHQQPFSPGPPLQRKKPLLPTPTDNKESPTRTVSDDFDLLLERHKLIQQQLDALEKQEQAALEDKESELIDDSFIDIPVGDLKSGKEANYETEISKLGNEFDKGGSNQNDSSTSKNTSNSRTADLSREKEKTYPKAFCPFKIHPLHPAVPSLQDLSKERNNADTQSIDKPDTSPCDNLPGSTNTSQNAGHSNYSKPKNINQPKGQGLNMKRKRRRARKRKQRDTKLRAGSNSNEGLSQPRAHVDAHSELEERLLTLAVTPADQLNATVNADVARSDDVLNRQKKRRERVKQWQQTRVDSSSLQKGPSPGRRKTVEAYDQDDYLETPMDVESDTTEGPVLPLIEEAGDDLPPPPPPLPGDIELKRIQGNMQPFGLYAGQPLNQLPPNLYGFYPPGQLMYNEWPSAAPHSRQQMAEEPDNLTPDSCPEKVPAPSQKDMDPGNAGLTSDEQHDEAEMLRELLLKSVAKKRAAKSSANKEEKSSPSSPASPSGTVTVQALSPHSQPAPKRAAPQHKDDVQVVKTGRKPMVYSAPKHDPVVIQLGGDSDDSEEEELEQQRKGGSGGWGFFGSLDKMIKQARESVEASKVKPDTSREQAEQLPSRVPKTPDALDHLSDDRKAEYRLLKEQLAQRESKKRQPLADVNQDKEIKSGEVTTEEKSDTGEESSELTMLKEKAESFEHNLAAHRKVLGNDRTLLAKLTTVLTKKASLLETQEERIQRLKIQLEAAEAAAASNKSVVKRLHVKATVVKERIRKKLVVISNVEEDYLRAKSLMSAARRNPGLYIPEMAGSENQAATELTRNRGDNILGTAKRNHEEDVGGPSENAKRTKLDGPKISRKQEIAERIAQEKARLKKLEKQLAERLRDYNRSSDSESSSSSMFGIRKRENTHLQNTTSSSQTSGREVGVNSSVSKGSENKEATAMEIKAVRLAAANTSRTEPQKADNVPNTIRTEPQKDDNAVMATTNPALGLDTEGTTTSADEEDEKFYIPDRQLDYVNKLQDEKEKKGPVFPVLVTEIPQPVHKRAVMCVSLMAETTAIQMAVPCDKLAWLVQWSEKAAPKEHEDDDEQVPAPLLPYDSVLLYFKSYRLSPYFRTKSNLSLSSLSFSNKISPRVRFCKFDVQGVCNDSECPYQHLTDYKLTETEGLRDLAAYVSEGSGKEGRNKVEEKVQGLVDSFTKQYEGKMSWDQLYVLLVNRVKYIQKKGAPYNISLGARLVRLQQDKQGPAASTKEVIDKGTGVLHIRQGDTAGQSTAAAACRSQQECQEIRYFSEAYNCVETLASAVKETPSDVGLWIKLAQLRLLQKPTESQQDGDRWSREEEHKKANLMQALDTLSRGLEANSHSQELWLEYLQLFAQQGSHAEQQELCEQALEFVPGSHAIWCHYLLSTNTYSDKRSVCIRLISHLTRYDELSDVQSHRILESVLYLVQLELYTGHFKSALAVLQTALGKGKPSTDEDITSLVHHLQPPDLCLLWLAYIHVFEFHSLPQPWYDPNYSSPAMMVTRKSFVFPWQPGKGTRASSEKLLGMFHDSLRACTACKKTASDKVSLCLPLYRNLLALERAHSRHDSAKGICRRLLQGTPAEFELWLYLAALEDSTGPPDKAAEVYEEAMRKTCYQPQITYSAARFHLEQGNPEAALKCLVKCVQAKFIDMTRPPSSLVESADGSPDPILLYRKLLSQPLPYDCKPPPLMAGVDVRSLGNEEVYIWLGYCLLLELLPTASSLCLQYSLSARSAYETAVHSIVSRNEAQTVWLEYLFYTRDRANGNKMTADGLKAIDDLVNRCLVSVSTSSSLPYSSAGVWQDFSFHNQVINLYVTCLPKDCRSHVYSKYLKWYPNDLHLTLRACEHETSTGRLEQAKKIAVQFLAGNPSCITMWQIAISLELQRNHVNEARKMYQQSTKVLPFASSLWKDYLMFEVVRSKDSSIVSIIRKKCCKFGVDIEDYINTLMGKY